MSLPQQPFDPPPAPRPRSRLLWMILVALLGALAGRYLAGTRRTPLLDPHAAPREVVARGNLAEDEKATIDLFKRASPSVVHITSLAVRRNAFTLNAMEIPQGTGSGFIWDEQGHIVTNYHVVHGTDAWQVTLSDSNKYDASLVGFERDKDLAVLKIDAPQQSLPPIDVGLSTDLLVGQKVFAIGNPFGLDQTLTTGVISGLGREIKSTNQRPIQGVIQTDAAINPGNSGGPLLDSSGRMIGVNTAIVSPSGAYAGVGFAVPVDTVNRIVPELIKHGRVLRPGLGISAVEDQLTRRAGLDGVLVLDIDPNSSAAKAGLRPTLDHGNNGVILGDLIIGLDGDEIHSNDDLYKALDKHNLGDRVKVIIRRDGKTLQIPATLQGLSTNDAS